MLDRDNSEKLRTLCHYSNSYNFTFDKCQKYVHVSYMESWGVNEQLCASPMAISNL